LVLIAALAVTVGLGVIVASRAELRTDMGFFMPRARNADAAFVLDQMRSGPASNIVMIRLSGAPPAALARATAETAELVARVVDLAPALAWERAPADETPAEYYKGHAYCMIAGNGGFLPSDRFMLGLFLIAPGVFYPNHAHAADEVYYVLGGRAEWQIAGGAFEAEGPGGLVAMPSMTPHALRTGADPVLILWAWYGDPHGSFVYLTD